MLNGFEELLKDIDLPEEAKAKLIADTSNLSNGLVDKNKELVDRNDFLSSSLKSTGADDNSLIEKYNALAESNKALERFKSEVDEKDALKLKNYAEAKEISDNNHKMDSLANADAHKKELDAAIERSNGFESQLKTIMVDGEITKELLNLDVKKELMDMAHASIAQQSTFTDGKAMVGDHSLSDYMKTWAESDAGKAARSAPNNSGGGATGSGRVTTTQKPNSDRQSNIDRINKRFEL